MSVAVELVTLPCVPTADKVSVKVPAPVTTARLPVRVADALGVNWTTTLQVPETATEAPQVVDTKLKSLPAVLVTDADVGTVTDKAPIPVLVMVAVAVVLLPTCVVAKDSAEIEADCARPVPERAAVSVPAPVASVSVPVRVPAAVGVNLTVTVQVPLGATVAPHVVET